MVWLSNDGAVGMTLALGQRRQAVQFLPVQLQVTSLLIRQLT